MTDRRIIEIVDRDIDGNYLIEPGFIHSFPFVVPTNGFMRTSIHQFAIRGSYSIRSWMSIRPYDTELFFRFHPGTGGLTHMVYDVNMAVVPTPVKGQTQRNKYSQIQFTPQDTLIALDPGIYYFNVMNMELQHNGYKLALIE